jgi:hypothetical protein
MRTDDQRQIRLSSSLVRQDLIRSVDRDGFTKCVADSARLSASEFRAEHFIFSQQIQPKTMQLAHRHPGISGLSDSSPG